MELPKTKKNIYIYEQLDITLIKDKIKDNHIRWYENVLRRPTIVVVWRNEIITISGTRKGRGRYKNFFYKL